MSPLSDWANFYVIVGSSAGALIGLTFVVITLLAGRRREGLSWGVAAFNTPTVVNFGAALLVAAVLSAPWPALWQAAIPLGLCGLCGAGYIVVIGRRLNRREQYEPVPEDWLWFVAAPLLAYAALFAAALLLAIAAATPTLFIAGATILLLLFIGIHNAWDLVTYVAIEVVGPEAEKPDSDPQNRFQGEEGDDEGRASVASAMKDLSDAKDAKDVKDAKDTEEARGDASESARPN